MTTLQEKHSKQSSLQTLSQLSTQLLECQLIDLKAFQHMTQLDLIPWICAILSKLKHHLEQTSILDRSNFASKDAPQRLRPPKKIDINNGSLRITQQLDQWEKETRPNKPPRYHPRGVFRRKTIPMSQPCPVIGNWNNSTKLQSSSSGQLPAKGRLRKAQHTSKAPRDCVVDSRGLICSSMIDPTFKCARNDALTSIKSQPNIIRPVEVRANKVMQVDATRRQDLEIVHQVCKWLRRTIGLGFHVDPPGDTDLQAFLDRAATMFYDGVFLCQIAAYVAHKFGGAPIRSKLRQLGTQNGKPGQLVISGCTESPQNNAQCLQNVNLALAMLRQFGAIPQQSIWNGEKIRNGQHNMTIWRLLDQIRKLCYESKRTQQLTPVDIRANVHDNAKVTSVDRGTKMATARGRAAPGITSQNQQSRKPKSRHQQQQQRVPHITKEQIQATRTWLYRMGYDLNLRPSSDLLQDPLRNGVLFCELLQLIASPYSILSKFQYHKSPSAVHMAQENLSRFFQCLAKVCADTPGVPSAYFSEMNAIIQGDNQTIWGLLWYLMQTFPPLSTGTIDGRWEKQQKLGFHPYKPSEYNRLEKSLIAWIQSLGLLPSEHFNPAYLLQKQNEVDVAIPSSLSDMKEVICNGTLLCDLTSFITSLPIPGVHRKPVTNALALANIRKALNVLRRCKNVSNRYLWNEREVAEGNRRIVLGLLEDLHRACDGLIPRPAVQTEGEQPYYGDPALMEVYHEDHRRPSIDPPQIIGNTIAPYTANALTSDDLDDHFTRVHSAAWSNSVVRREHVLQSSKISICNDTNPPAFYESVTLNILQDDTDIQPTPDREEQSPPEEHIECSRIEGSDGDEIIPTDSIKNEQVASERLSPELVSESMLEKLVQWLKSLHVASSDTLKMLSVSYYQNKHQPLRMFSNGILLCKIVEKVEFMRTLENIQLGANADKKQHRARCLYNIRKALAILKQKRQMPLDYLHREVDIYTGNPAVILALLQQIRKAYGYHKKNEPTGKCVPQ